MNGLIFRDIQLQNTTRVDTNLQKRLLTWVQTAASSSSIPNKLTATKFILKVLLSRQRRSAKPGRNWCKPEGRNLQVRDFIFESSSIKLTPVLRFTSPAHAHFTECVEVLRLSHTSADASTVLLGTLSVQTAGLELPQLATAVSERPKDACDQICVVLMRLEDAFSSPVIRGAS